MKRKSASVNLKIPWNKRDKFIQLDDICILSIALIYQSTAYKYRPSFLIIVNNMHLYKNQLAM